jgi:hypothetical protein
MVHGTKADALRMISSNRPVVSRMNRRPMFLSNWSRKYPLPAIVQAVGRAEPSRRGYSMAAFHVRRDKAALSSGCKAHPAIRSIRKQPEQAWR